MKVIVVTIFSAFLLFSCQVKSPSTVGPRPDMLTLINTPNILLVDVRVPEQFSKNTANGAVNIPLAEISNRIDELKDKRVILFCNTGKQAGQALELLKKAGLTDVYSGVNVYNVKALQQVSNTN